MLVLAVNLAVLILAVKTGSLGSSGVSDLVHHWREVVPAGTRFILVGIANGLLSAEAKARLVSGDGQIHCREALLSRDTPLKTLG